MEEILISIMRLHTPETIKRSGPFKKIKILNKLLFNPSFKPGIVVVSFFKWLKQRPHILKIFFPHSLKILYYNFKISVLLPLRFIFINGINAMRFLSVDIKFANDIKGTMLVPNLWSWVGFMCISLSEFLQYFPFRLRLLFFKAS